jgi:polysaccharide deacetylase family protein (PEP-CTERM system associated)
MASVDAAEAHRLEPAAARETRRPATISDFVRVPVAFDPDRPINAMSVDVEDYFHVRAFADTIDARTWDSIPCRVAANVDRILELFDAAGVKATFFTLGWVAERYPEVIRRIVAGGHELASHGYEHTLATEQTPEVFHRDVALTKRILEDVGGVEVRGYRASTFSIGRTNLWAFDELQSAGYEYSSSLNPVRHDLYGMPEAPRSCFRHRSGGLVEIPLTTVRMGARNLPFAGGGFFRLLPYPVFRWGIRRVNAVDGQPAVFYFHPWEVDPQQPRVAGASWRSSFRHYLNIEHTAPRLRKLLRDFRWGRMDEVFGLRVAAAPPGSREAA